MSDEGSMSREDWESSLYWGRMFRLRQTDPRAYHEERCKEGDGWSHAFHVGRSPVDGSVESVSSPDVRVLEFFAAENWRRMRGELSRSTAMIEVDLTRQELDVGPGFSAESIAGLFGAGGDDEADLFPLNELRLDDNKIGLAGMAALLPFLKSVSTLQCLSLMDTGLGLKGARVLSEALERVRIETLNLSHNSIGDGGVECLLSARNSKYLSLLSLCGNGIGRRGFVAISRFLTRADCSLESLQVTFPTVEVAEMLVGSIPNDSRLRSLYICPGAGDKLEGPVAATLQRRVCDVSSFHSIWSSNHTLCIRVDDSNTGMSETINRYPTLKRALDINARSRYGASVVTRMRSKLRAFYFHGDFDVHPFADINVKLIPYALELVTKTELRVGRVASAEGSGSYYEVPDENIDGVYRLLRNCNLEQMFGFPSPESMLRQKDDRISVLEAENAKLKAIVASLEKRLDRGEIDGQSLE